MSRPIEVVVSELSLEIDQESVIECLQLLDTIDGYSVPPGSLAVAFVDEQTCCSLHRDFFGDPDVTDVMTFPGDETDQHAGDIAICSSVALRASERENTLFAEELTLYLVHAWLHLAGFDDRDAKSIRSMRSAEAALLNRLRSDSRMLRARWCP